MERAIAVTMPAPVGIGLELLNKSLWVQLGGRIAGVRLHLFPQRDPEFLAKPASDREGEAALGGVEHRPGQSILKSLSQHALAETALNLEVTGER